MSFAVVSGRLDEAEGATEVTSEVYSVIETFGFFLGTF